ncbi:hypothetical protein BLNAU_5121 [Blattamonas nauphoetae]|uniref:Uncharacterized protein n=1 Tax=Blattamonas nauphoetae TaxID=2049346 RepID=A0ABQ9Y8A4_9EUKA|nr:hypothetical protein BLNAU_5121 [Blattamonas nauphoetae]
MQEGSNDTQPISSLSLTSFHRPIVAPIRHDELFFGVDSPICGSEDHPCATLGRALSQLFFTDDFDAIVCIYDGGKAEFGTRIENVTICGEDKTAHLVLQPHERGLEESRFFTTRQTIFFRIVIDRHLSSPIKIGKTGIN